MSPFFSSFLQLARLVHHRDPRKLAVGFEGRDPHKLAVGFEGLNYVVIGFPTAYSVFWLHLRELLFIVSQVVHSNELS